MKIIDEKGRLFGKLNLIDLLVIILLIAAVAAVAWKLVGKKAAETVADTGRTITYTVTVEDVNREAAEFASTQIGKPLVNNSKVVDAAITDAAVTDRRRQRACRPRRDHRRPRPVHRQRLQSRRARRCASGTNTSSRPANSS